MSFVFL